MNFEKEVKKIHVNIKSNQLNDAMRNCNKLIKLFPKNSYLFNLGGLILQNGLKIKNSPDIFVALCVVCILKVLNIIDF